MSPAIRPVLAAALTLLTAATAQALQHQGPVSGTWTAAASPHVVLADCRVPAGEQLTLEAGATVLFEVATGLVVDGTLIVDGQELAPVTLRSVVPGGRPGDWEGVVLAGPGDQVVRHAVIEDAVLGLDVRSGARAIIEASAIRGSELDAVVFRAGATGRVSDSLLSGNGGAGIVATDSSPSVQRCRFSANDVPVRVEGAAFPDLGGLAAAFHRRHDGVDVSTDRPLSGAGTWTDAGVPWVVDGGGTLVIEAGSLLLLRAGATLKLSDMARISVAGTLGSAGTPEAPCAITSLRDDTRGGDTNRDADATRPAKGAWNGIDVAAGGVVSLVETSLSWADDGLRGLAASTIALRRCVVGSCQERGVALGAGAAALIEETLLHDNDIGLLVMEATGVDVGRWQPDGTLAGGRNSFGCNAWADVENVGATVLPAHGNYWSGADPAVGSFRGLVDADPYLFSEPTGTGLRRVVRVARTFEPATVLITWNETAACLSYLVQAAALPQGPFGSLGLPTDGESSLVPADVPGARDVVYYRVVPLGGATAGNEVP